MKQYTGTKVINAEPMTRLAYNSLRGWKLPSDENGDDAGYLIEDINGSKNIEGYSGYIQWVTEPEFTRTYKVSGTQSRPLNANCSVGNGQGAKELMPDFVTWGDSDMFKLLSKFSSQNAGIMKSTKAMQIDGVGCVVQVTTQQDSNVAEAVTFIPGIRIDETTNDSNVVVSRSLVSI